MFNEVYKMDKLHKKAVDIIIRDMKEMTNEQIDELLFFEQNFTKHNNDLKKLCPKCGGKGEIKSAKKDLNGYDLEDCTVCDGQGFLKS